MARVSVHKGSIHKGTRKNPVSNSQYTSRGFPSSIKTQLGAENASQTRTNLVAASLPISRIRHDKLLTASSRGEWSVASVAR